MNLSASLKPKLQSIQFSVSASFSTQVPAQARYLLWSVGMVASLLSAHRLLPSSCLLLLASPGSGAGFGSENKAESSVANSGVKLGPSRRQVSKHRLFLSLPSLWGPGTLEGRQWAIAKSFGVSEANSQTSLCLYWRCPLRQVA